MKPVHLQRFTLIALILGLFFTSMGASLAQTRELDSLNQFVENSPAKDNLLVDALARLSYLYNTSDPQRGIRVGNHALKVSRELNYEDGMSRAFNSLGANYYSSEQFDKAVTHYDSAIYYKKRIGDTRGAMISEVNLGVIEADQKNFDQALQRYEKAYAYFEEVQEESIMGSILVNMAIVHRKMYATSEALRTYILAAEIAERSGYTDALASALSEMGIIYMSLNDVEGAMKARRRALSLVDENNNKRLKVRLLNGIGQGHTRLAAFDSAIYYHKSALALGEEIDSRASRAASLSYLGTVYRRKGDLKGALEYYQDALELRKTQSTKANMATLHMNLGRTYRLMKMPEKALLHFKEALAIAQTRKELGNVANSSEAIAMYYEAQGNLTKAYEHLKIHKEAMLKVNDSRDIGELSALATRYKTEKENQALLLKKAQEEALLHEQLDNERIFRNIIILISLAIVVLALVYIRFYKVKKRANARLTAQNVVISEQKESLALQAEKLKVVNSQLEMLSEFRTGLTQMIAHDMKNPLNAIIGLSGTQPSERNVKKIAESGYQMLNLVTNMLEVEKLEETRMEPKKEEVFIDEIIKSAKTQVEILLQAKSIFIQSTVPRQICMIADKEMMTRVMVNLLTNAIKYSDNGGSVRIRHEVLPEGFLRISVEDDGQGIDAERLPYIFDKFWQSDQKKSGIAVSTGLGLTFCRLAVESHGGKIWADSVKGKGTSFTFKLKLNQEACLQFLNLGKGPDEQRESLILNKELSMLTRYSDRLSQHQVHEVGAITRLIKEMDLEDISSRWKQDLQAAVYEGDQEKYDELLGMLAES